MKFRKRPIVVEATQWFKNGDHPLDDCHLVHRFHPDVNDGALVSEKFTSEGKIVRYFRRPDVSGTDVCLKVGCNRSMHDHGWIETLEGGYVVCPGDWIITGVMGEHYPCKPAVFEATYEAADSAASEF